jgi:TM2 domain-containing membrane protein YozV
MKHSIKGALLSGLLFPGLGQIAMKHYIKGMVLIVTVFAAIIMLVVEATQRAQAILQQIQAEGGTVSMYTITDAANRSVEESGGTVSSVALLLIVACWCYGVVDAYLIGKKIDSGNNS